MTAWKANDNLEFNFADCQLQDEINSDDEQYIKRRCRERINMASTYLLLIGSDTRYKNKYVKWEAEVAIEKRCRIIGVNLDDWRFVNPATCPGFIDDVGAMFVPYSPQIVQHALQNATRREHGNWRFIDDIYAQLGYRIVGDRAERPPKPSPFW